MSAPATRSAPTYGAAWRALCKLAFQLYGRTCHICSQPGADTIDHLDPVKYHGGALPHISRVRPAHRSCNSKRGAGPVRRSRRSRRW